MLEAICGSCGETFIPHSEAAEDLIHGETEAGIPCSGQGTVQGEWVPSFAYPYGKGNQGPGTGPDGERLI